MVSGAARQPDMAAPEGEAEHTEARAAPLAQPDHPALRHIDPSTRFLYTPHTVTSLIIGTRLCHVI